MTDVAVLEEAETAQPGSLLPHFVSVFGSGFHLGHDVGRRAGREQVFRRLEECFAVAPLRQVDGADIFGALGDPERAKQLRDHIERAREQWWKREEMRLEREDERLQDIRAQQERTGAHARDRLDATTPDSQREMALRLRAAYLFDTWGQAPTWDDLCLSEAQAWARAASEACR